jgi:hypothetical protein
VNDFRANNWSLNCSAHRFDPPILLLRSCALRRARRSGERETWGASLSHEAPISLSIAVVARSISESPRGFASRQDRIPLLRRFLLRCCAIKLIGSFDCPA